MARHRKYKPESARQWRGKSYKKGVGGRKDTPIREHRDRDATKTDQAPK